MARSLNVFCLEGNWAHDDLTDRSSLEPLLDLLERHTELEYIRRDVATRAEFDYYLRRWKKSDCDFAYFAFHGDHDCSIALDDGKITFNALGRKLREYRAAKDRILFIASCYGLAVSEKALEQLRAQTGAVAICGYRTEVDTLEAAAFELLLMHELYGNWRVIGSRIERFVRRYRDLADRLEFVWAQA